jgi:membrane-bound lytic murein transglycosylase MltF
MRFWILFILTFQPLPREAQRLAWLGLISQKLANLKTLRYWPATVDISGVLVYKVPSKERTRELQPIPHPQVGIPQM